ncbi:competence damage-inducible protein A [Terrabacter tumescens]|uniref:Competence damage-inducible protein A n=1 Tax=Terrabacter tumescens TaxID=60443 RepID=A0ABQ2HHP9_9MICO|nr:CinA family protein [Terrabacter tumescens]GGM81194.1 competence damage-inducible protein A [Terrabacter tumescens]
MGVDDTPGSLLVAGLTAAGQTLACAESLTAGLVAATVADTPGASVVLLGGVVAYAAQVKSLLLDVPTELIARVGTVDPAVAVAMAEGVRRRLGATWGLSTTGVAGPGPSEGKPAGTVHVAVAGPSGTATRALRLNGTRAEIRSATVDAVLRLAVEETGATRRTPAPPWEPRGTVGLSGHPGGDPAPDHTTPAT